MIDLQYFIRDFDKCSEREKQGLIKAMVAYADSVVDFDADVHNQIYDWYFYEIRQKNEKSQ